MKHIAILLLALALPGCAAQIAHRNAQALLGLSVIEVESALGHPDSIATGDDAVTVLTFVWQAPASSTSIPLADLALAPIAWPVSLATAGTITMGTSKGCRLVVTLRHNRVTHVAMSGDNSGISGAGAACEPLLRGVAP